jgi:multiple sugar transport system permease protein
VVFMFPLIYMLSTSLKTDQDQYVFPPIIPHPVDWRNYPLGWTTVGFGHFYLVSIAYAVLSTLGVLFSCSLAAYALARLRFRLRDLIFFIIVATLLLPSQVTLIPLYLIYKHLGWLNTLAPLIVPQWFGVNAFSIFLLRQFFLTLPRDLDDAARIDGCSEFDIWLRIVLPLSRPALGVVALFQGVGAWTDFFGPLIYEQTQNNFPVSVGLNYFQSSFGAMHFNQEMAMTVVSVLPVFVVFFLFQKYFIRGIVLSGVSR